MKRILFALVVAGIQVAANAAPPTTAVTISNTPLPVTVSGTPTVTVGNQLVPVSVIPTYTPIARYWEGGTRYTITTTWGGDENFIVGEDLILVGVTLDVDWVGEPPQSGPLAWCYGFAAAKPADDSYHSLASIQVRAGARDGRYIPMPNLYLPTGTQMQLGGVHNGTSACSAQVGWHFIRPDTK